MFNVYIIALMVVHIPSMLCSGVEADISQCPDRLDGSRACESGSKKQESEVQPVSLLQTDFKVKQASHFSKQSFKQDAAATVDVVATVDGSAAAKAAHEGSAAAEEAAARNDAAVEEVATVDETGAAEELFKKSLDNVNKTDNDKKGRSGGPWRCCRNHEGYRYVGSSQHVLWWLSWHYGSCGNLFDGWREVTDGRESMDGGQYCKDNGCRYEGADCSWEAPSKGYVEAEERRPVAWGHGGAKPALVNNQLIKGDWKCHRGTKAFTTTGSGPAPQKTCYRPGFTWYHNPGYTLGWAHSTGCGLANCPWTGSSCAYPRQGTSSSSYTVDWDVTCR